MSGADRTFFAFSGKYVLNIAVGFYIAFCFATQQYQYCHVFWNGKLLDLPLGPLRRQQHSTYKLISSHIWMLPAKFD